MCQRVNIKKVIESTQKVVKKSTLRRQKVYENSNIEDTYIVVGK